MARLINPNSSETDLSLKKEKRRKREREKEGYGRKNPYVVIDQCVHLYCISRVLSYNWLFLLDIFDLCFTIEINQSKGFYLSIYF